MATLMSCATGNFTTSTTWALCDSTSENDSIANSTTISTSNVDSTAFTPGVITVDGIAVRIATRTASPGAGTLTVTLRNSSLGSDVTSVTVNVSDLHTNAKGWYFFKFSSSQLLLAATNYVVRMVSSIGAACTVYTSTGTNFARQLRTTTTQAPASGDKLLFNGELTGAGTSNVLTVTLDNTATTSFGPTVSGGPPYGVAIGDKGVFQLGSTGSTNYYFKMKGILDVAAGGQLLLDNDSGTSGSVTAASNKASVGYVDNITNATPMVVTTSAAHGLSTGDIIQLRGVVGTTAANGYFSITVIDSLNFSLQDSAGSDVAGNGNYQYGGQWIAGIVCTSTAHGLSTGDLITLTGVVGNIGANGAWIITAFGADKFVLEGSMGIAAYTSGGTWKKRTNLTSSSTCVLEFDSVTNVDSGMQIQTDGIVSGHGASKTVKTTVKESTVIGSDTNSVGSLVTTSGTGVTWVEGAKFDTGWTGTFTLNGTSYTISSVPSITSIIATATITTGASSSGIPATFAKTTTGGPTVLKVEDTTGWAATDVLGLSSSSQRYQDAESVTISTVDSSTQITATSAFTSYHSGLNDTAGGDVRSSVVNITRNIKIRGVSTSLQGYIHMLGATAKLACKYVEFYNFGSATAAKQGFTCTGQASQAGFNLQYCSCHDFTVSGSVVFRFINTSGNNYPILQNVVCYNNAHDVLLLSTTSGLWTVDSCTFISGPGTTSPFVYIYLQDVGGYFVNNVCSGSRSNGNIYFGDTSQIGYFADNSFQNGGIGISFTFDFVGIFGNGTATQRVWRNIAATTLFPGIRISSIINGLKLYGNGSNTAAQGQAVFSGTGPSYYKNLVIEPGVNYSTFIGCTISAGRNILDSCLFGQNTAFATSDIYDGAFGFPTAIFKNCKFSKSTWFTDNNVTFGNGTLTSLNHNQSGLFEQYKTHEIIPTSLVYTVAKLNSDTVIYNNSSPSLRITPATLSAKLRSPTFYAPVSSGSILTPSIWLRKSIGSDTGGGYNGTQPRLLIYEDSYIGINPLNLKFNIVASGNPATSGVWEQVTGTVTGFNGDGIARFFVDCDGTAGFINIDDFSCKGTKFNKGMGYWGQDFYGPAAMDSPATISPNLLGGFDG